MHHLDIYRGVDLSLTHFMVVLLDLGPHSNKPDCYCDKRQGYRERKVYPRPLGEVEFIVRYVDKLGGEKSLAAGHLTRASKGFAYALVLVDLLLQR